MLMASSFGGGREEAFYSPFLKTPMQLYSSISVGCALMASSFGGGREEALYSPFLKTPI
jgi:hypothetical protein